VRFESVSQPTPFLPLGRYPTPVERLDPGLLPPMGEAEIWVKRDDRTHDVVGGNKVRKLEFLLADARARGATHVWTVGAAGSHHVLATAYFGRREGFTVGAVLVPQPRTEHVVEVLRASLALGLEATAAGSWAAAAAKVLWRLGLGGESTGRRSRFIPLGGSNALGARAYRNAARELAAQVRAKEMPEPDLCVVALGSGGTAAGLAAGFAAEGMKTEVLGIAVSQPVWMVRRITAHLIHTCMGHLGDDRGETPRASRKPRWSVDASFLGPGYGYATPEGESASATGARVGLALDATYTAKAFAGVLTQAKAAASKKPRAVILYWHTLSSAPLAPLAEFVERDAASKQTADAHMARLSRLLVLPPRGARLDRDSSKARP
jgi:1-aminocyclopropane-1-carboxylate deaminase/D-cysteine desulfhydrase-like pyridoxal-dependent ACC family enzyme